MRSLFGNRFVLAGIAAVVIAGAAYAAWYQFLSNRVREGVGDFGYEFSSCQDEVFADLMEPADLIWAPDTQWYQGNPQLVRIGGKFTRVDTRTGKRKAFGYECTARNRRIMNANVN